jgi:peroxin-6
MKYFIGSDFLFLPYLLIMAGCGKRTVVRHVAKSLGLHVVEYNCYDLLGASERKTSVALGQAFNTAQR